MGLHLAVVLSYRKQAASLYGHEVIKRTRAKTAHVSAMILLTILKTIVVVRTKNLGIDRT